MGVWIETLSNEAVTKAAPVTPFVGVWIETYYNQMAGLVDVVTPFVGVWIETFTPTSSRRDLRVTPFVGVWIETSGMQCMRQFNRSHPSWVCGLKPLPQQPPSLGHRHTLRGCVD